MYFMFSNKIFQLIFLVFLAWMNPCVLLKGQPHERVTIYMQCSNFLNVYVLLKFLLKYYFICFQCICMPCDSNVSYEVTYYVIAGSKYGYGASTISRYVTSSGVFKRTESHEKVYNVPKYHIRYITSCIIKKIIP